MARPKFSFLFVAAAPLLLLITAVHVEARKPQLGVNPFCRTSDYRRLCTSMVTGATNLNQASANALKNTLELARRAQSQLFRLKPAISQLELQNQESIMAACTEHFENTVSDIEDSMQALEANDLGTLRVKLSAAYDRSECADELSRFGVDCPVSRIIVLMGKQVSNCLAVVQQN